MGLKIDLKPGESLVLDQGNIIVRLIEKSGQRARVEVIADKDVSIEKRKSQTSASLAAGGLSVKAA